MQAAWYIPRNQTRTLRGRDEKVRKNRMRPKGADYRVQDPLGNFCPVVIIAYRQANSKGFDSRRAGRRIS
jgi:hypothetical protein